MAGTRAEEEGGKDGGKQSRSTAALTLPRACFVRVEEEEEEEEEEGIWTTKAWRLPRPTKASRRRRRTAPLLACGGDCCMAVGVLGLGCYC